MFFFSRQKSRWHYIFTCVEPKNREYMAQIFQDNENVFLWPPKTREEGATTVAKRKTAKQK